MKETTEFYDNVCYKLFKSSALESFFFEKVDFSIDNLMFFIIEDADHV